MLFDLPSQGRIAGCRIGGDRSAGVRPPGQRAVAGWVSDAHVLRNHEIIRKILAIRYILEMMVSRAIEFSKHQCLPQRICSAQTASTTAGNRVTLTIRPSLCVAMGSAGGANAPDNLVACRDQTAWLGWEDSNSEMSSQIIPLKARADSQDPSRILAMETIRV